jgi:hypothetical protein
VLVTRSSRTEAAALNKLALLESVGGLCEAESKCSELALRGDEAFFCKAVFFVFRQVSKIDYVGKSKIYSR